MCDQEVITLIQDKTPTRSPAPVSSRPGSIATVDYSTQGDPNQPAPLPTTGSGNKLNSIDNTRNFLLPDGTGRRILDIPISERKPVILDNGHSAYQIQLKNLEPVLETSTYLINRLTSQFHMVYDDGYQQMATMLMIWSTWEEGQLVAKLNETRTCFGLPPTNTPVKKPAVCQQVASSDYPEKPESSSASGTGRYSCTRADKPATTSQNNGILGAILQLGNTSLQAQNG